MVTAIDSLSAENLETLFRTLLYTRSRRTGGSVSEVEMDQAQEWAEETAARYQLLQHVLGGSLMCDMVEGVMVFMEPTEPICLADKIEAMVSERFEQDDVE